MSFSVTVKEAGAVTVVTAEGRITIGGGSDALNKAMNGRLGEGQTRFLLALGGVSYMDSAGLGVITGMLASCMNRGGELKLVTPSLKVRALLEVTNLWPTFEVHASEQEGVASFGG
ncbi:MAG: STAS domain-containing protein [Acidobacteria bacterium]|nr:STAS domain-containing protein [Acidobacteriota bacterium]